MESLEVYSALILWSVNLILFYICFDAYLVDTDLERTMCHRNKIKHIYAKVISMNLMEIRSFLDNTNQNQGLIKLNERTQAVSIVFEHYNFEFLIDNDNCDYHISINDKRLDMEEMWNNYKNAFTIEYFYDILIYHKFDTLICEAKHRDKFGLFLASVHI